MLTRWLALCKYGQFQGEIHFAFQWLYIVQYFSLMVTAMWLRQAILQSSAFSWAQWLMTSRDELGIAKSTSSGDFITTNQLDRGKYFPYLKNFFFLANNSNHAAHLPSEHEAIKVIWEPQSPQGCYFCLESRFAFVILTRPFHGLRSWALFLGSLCCVHSVSRRCGSCFCTHHPTHPIWFSCSWDVKQKKNLVENQCIKIWM